MRPKPLKNFGSNIPILGQKKQPEQKPMDLGEVMERSHMSALMSLRNLHEGYKKFNGENALDDPEHEEKYRMLMLKVCELPSASLVGSFSSLPHEKAKFSYTLTSKEGEEEKIAVYCVRGKNSIRRVDSALSIVDDTNGSCPRD